MRAQHRWPRLTRKCRTRGVNRLSEEREIFKGKIGLHDMVLTVNAAKEVAGEGGEGRCRNKQIL